MTAKMEDVFTTIYKTNSWRSAESVSGPGSSIQVTANVRNIISDLVLRHKIKLLLDLPCGDFNWMKEVDLHGAQYLGSDFLESFIIRSLAFNVVLPNEFLHAKQLQFFYVL